MEEPLILDRYRPLADLGSGGHGSVTLAFDTRMARRVAVKRLPLPVDRSGRIVGRAGLSEARTGALLNHPNIVTVHEWDTDADEAFIVMEAVEGASLAALLDSGREPLDLDEAAAVLDAVAAAVSFAHENGVLHLDLKPSNVLITRDGRVKVADFGVSALTDISGYAHGTAGTIGYMPPEQLRAEPLDERADVWALGALLYELLTDACPFDSETADGSLFKIEVAPVPAPSEFEPDLPDGVDEVLLAALAATPGERHSSIEELADALMPWLGDPAIGRQELAERVSECVDECVDTEEYTAALGLWDRLAWLAPVARRGAAALGGAWLGWAGASAFDFGQAPVAAVAAMVALAGALAPALGAALGFVVIAAGLGAAHGLLVGAMAAAVLAAFWATRARQGSGEALLPLLAPALGVVRAGLALPLLLGFVFPPLPAAVSAGFGAVFLAAAAAATGAQAPLLSTPLGLLLDPWETLGRAANANVPGPGLAIAVLAWTLAAWITSRACRGASRASAAFGSVLGALVLGLGYAGWATVEQATFAPSAIAPDAVISAAVVIVVIALGAPTRPEEE